MALHERVPWPPDGILMVMPYDPRLHAPGSKGTGHKCLWGDHDAEARWSAVWRGERWAVCDTHLAALARAEFNAAETPPQPASTADLPRRFHEHVIREVNRLKSRYDPRLFLQMVQAHGAVGATKRLLADPRHTSYGFEKLWEMGELQSSVEFAVCLPWFAELFSDAERDEAERRLLLHEFPLKERLSAVSARPPAWVSP